MPNLRKKDSRNKKEPGIKKRHPDSLKFDGLKQLREATPPYLAMFHHPDPSRRKHPSDRDDGYPFGILETVLVLGEIENMREHVALVTRGGKYHFGYHAENFRKLSKLEA